MFVFEFEEPEAEAEAEAVGAFELLPPDSRRDDHDGGIAHLVCLYGAPLLHAVGVKASSISQPESASQLAST